MKYFLNVIYILIMSGCVSTAVQTEALLKNKPAVENFHQVEQVPFVNQEAGQCGPATLTMAMNWAGKMISVEEVSPQVFTPGMKGSLQSDLIGASRRNGLMAVPIEGLSALLIEINSGHPVIVFENLALSWLPQWHYAIVFGYDLTKQEMIMHSGPEAFKHWDMSKFERSWMLANYWGLVVLPAGELCSSADELANSVAAAGLEQVGQKGAAEKSYAAILKKWPSSLTALVGSANLAFEKENYILAVSYLKQATKFYPGSATVWHNLTIAEGRADMMKEAHESAMQALLLASVAEKEKFNQNLKPWL